MKSQKLYVIRISDKFRKIYDKSIHLEHDLFEVKEYYKSYDEYIEPSLLYFTQDPRKIAKALEVKRVIPMGQYIRGLLGGEAGRGRPYAGLVLVEYSYGDSEFEFRLYGTTTKLSVPKVWLPRYGVDVYELIYVGMINPFRLKRLLPVLLSNRGSRSLREFLRVSLGANTSKMPSSDVEKISTLINELKQPESLDIMNRDFYYVVYRCDRAFTACLIKPSSRTVLDSHVSAIECEDESKAYYYVGVLNYLAYKVVAKGRTFPRHQFARPALAIVIAGLSWRDIDANVGDRVIELVRKLEQKVPTREFPNQRIALNYIANYAEFKKLIEVLDENVEKERLEQALSLVSGTSNKKRK